MSDVKILDVEEERSYSHFIAPHKKDFVQMHAQVVTPEGSPTESEAYGTSSSVYAWCWVNFSSQLRRFYCHIKLIITWSVRAWVWVCVCVRWFKSLSMALHEIKSNGKWMEMEKKFSFFIIIYLESISINSVECVWMRRQILKCFRNDDDLNAQKRANNMVHADALKRKSGTKHSGFQIQMLFFYYSNWPRRILNSTRCSRFNRT